MRNLATSLGLAVGALALSLSTAAPARAEFFGCNDKPGQLLYSYNGPATAYHSRRATHSRRRYTDDYSAQSRTRAGYSRPATARQHWYPRATVGTGTQ